MSDFIPRFDRNSIPCNDGSLRATMKYTHDDVTGIWFGKAEKSLNYKNIKAADISERESSADFGSKE